MRPYRNRLPSSRCEGCTANSVLPFVVATKSKTATWLFLAGGGPPVGLSCVHTGVPQPVALESLQTSMNTFPLPSFPPKISIPPPAAS